MLPYGGVAPIPLILAATGVITWTLADIVLASVLIVGAGRGIVEVCRLAVGDRPPIAGSGCTRGGTRTRR